MSLIVNCCVLFTLMSKALHEGLPVHPVCDVKLCDCLPRACGVEVEVSPHVGKADGPGHGDVAVTVDVEGLSFVAVGEIDINLELLMQKRNDLKKTIQLP